MHKFLGQLEWPRVPNPRALQYACVYSAIPLGICSFAGLLASGFFPPPPPSWSAEQTVNHYRDHEKGIQAGAALLVWCSFFYLAFTVAISNQLQRIPNLHYIVKALQLVAGGVSSTLFLWAGLVLGLANYRIERNAETTQVLNDLFWFLLVMATPTFVAQYFAFGYSIFVDNSPRRPFPKAMGVSNMITSILFLPPAVSVHIVKTGPMAWDGAVSFWLPLVVWGIQMVLDFICLVRAISLSAETDTSEEVAIMET
ncbi:membrane protein [Daldinia vernicosa]|uniref:uncharacterized protein n=1 Tax=Daldinia vernicosa TaxID=114800 RepID=UPI00200894D5|nr:uncharacterized protein F5Y00DRAFT_268950 [Daldinia vernicosa]KAI0849532.1 membrane protein [Daldinia vernicosa]